MNPLGQVLEVQRDGQRLHLRTEQAVLELDFLTERVLRARLLFDDDAPIGQAVALPLRDDALAASIEAGPPLTMKGPKFSVQILDPLRLVFRDFSDAVLLQGMDTSCLAFECVDDGRRRVQARFRRATEEHYYGLGQVGPGLDRDGTTRRLWNSHYGYGPGSDMAVPLVISSRGYGLFFDNSWDAEVALGRNEERNALVYTAEGGRLDWYFIYGPHPKSILAEYAQLTGHPPMPPRWSLGYIQSTRHFESPAEVVDLAETLRRKRIPCDAIVFLSTYGPEMGMNNGVGTLEFHPRLWADADGLMRALHERHFRVVSHEYPVIGPKSDRYAEAKSRGYLVDYVGAESSVMFNEGQSYLDFTSPAVGQWWWDAHRQLLDLGVDGWWLDGGEGPPSSVELQGGPGQALHNVFDFYRQQAFSEGEKRSRPDRRHWLLCRSGYAAMQRLGSACWSGDINNTFGVFEAQAPLGLSTSMSGVPYWGTDIGGFFHTVPETGELFVRWFQFAAFCPIFRSHGRGIGRPGWLQHLPWAHGTEIEEICRTFADLRYQLFPYNYSLAWEAHHSGLPLMRPLVLEYPDDPHAVDMSSQFLWGASLLVAPVTRGGATRWAVYLPRGSWYDFWTHEAYAGGGWVEVAAPLERLPVFVRGGAIIPMGPSVQHSDQLAEATSLLLLVYPDGDSSFELYEDDGVSREYENGVHAITTIRCSRSDDAVRLRLEPRSGQYAGAPGAREVVVRIYLPSPPLRVSVDGAEVPRVQDRTMLEASAASWWHDGEKFVWVAFRQALEGVDIECARSA